MFKKWAQNSTILWVEREKERIKERGGGGGAGETFFKVLYNMEIWA